MYPSLFQKDGRSRLRVTLVVALQGLAFICIFAASAAGQRPGPSQPARDLVLSITRKEMDRMLDLKPLPPLKNDPTRRAVLKQIGDDFREMQRLNNKMMAQAWSKEELNYRYISDMVSQIRGKATSLKNNLSLPEIKDDISKQFDIRFSDDQKFRAALLLLDRRIMSFATNPLFQKPDVVEIELANKASRDLGAVIDLSGRIRKEASALGKAHKSSR